MPASDDLTKRDRLNGAVARSLHKLPAALRPAPVTLDGQTLDPDVQLMLKARDLAGERELQELPVEKARRSYRRQFISIEPPPERVYHVEDLTIPGPAGPIPVRWYSPPPAEEGLPMLVHFHGGGHTVGDPDTCDTASRMVTRHGGVAVLSVDYRMGPENPFPAAYDDALAAFRYVAEHAERFGVDPERIAVGGDSAGGNLGAAVSQGARDEGGPRPAFQWLIYPVADMSSRVPSRDLFGEGFLLTDLMIEWFHESYLGDADVTDVRLSPGLAEDLTDLPPAYVATGGFDPLRDYGENYGRQLLDAGIPCTVQRFDSLVHGFANLTAVSPAARDAMLQAVGALRMGLAARKD